MVKWRISGGLAGILFLTSIFSICPPNKHGTIESYASVKLNLATPSEASIDDEDETSEDEPDEIDLIDDIHDVATPSDAKPDSDVHIKTDAKEIDLDDLSNVSLLEMAETVEMSSNDNIAVRVPAFITMAGNSTESQFVIEIIGTMESDSTLNINTPDEFKLSAYMKEDITAKIELSKYEITKDDFENERVLIDGTITLDRNLTAGKWTGDFNINVGLDSPSLEAIEWEYLQQLEEPIDPVNTLPVEPVKPVEIAKPVVDEPISVLPDISEKLPVVVDEILDDKKEESASGEKTDSSAGDEDTLVSDQGEPENKEEEAPDQEQEPGTSENESSDSEDDSLTDSSETSDKNDTVESDNDDSNDRDDTSDDVEVDTGSNDESQDNDTDSRGSEESDSSENEDTSDENDSDSIE